MLYAAILSFKISVYYKVISSSSQTDLFALIRKVTISIYTNKSDSVLVQHDNLVKINSFLKISDSIGNAWRT